VRCRRARARRSWPKVSDAAFRRGRVRADRGFETRAFLRALRAASRLGCREVSAACRRHGRRVVAGRRGVRTVRANDRAVPNRALPGEGCVRPARPPVAAVAPAAAGALGARQEAGFAFRSLRACPGAVPGR
ncbi:MAG: hypothetical protein D6718_13635, partial [Acidobacteria bacterium]